MRLATHQRKLTRFSSRLWALAALLTAGVTPPSAALAQNPDAGDLAEAQSSYVGARLLEANSEVQVGGMDVGVHDDGDRERNRFLFWEGDSLFAGVVDEETGNRLEMVGEFYWFESSIDRNADFYLVVLKVTSTPYPDTRWRVATEESWVDNVMLRDIGPVQQVEANVDDNGERGAIRWDWSVPFQNYRWEPERVIEVQQTYAAGLQAEGGAMASVTEGVNIQAKGVLSANHQVKSRYTITLWRWQMLVLAGATDMSWNLIALDPEHAQDPAYHEYFLVLQSERGEPAHLNHVRLAGTLREDIWMWPDNFMSLSASLNDITLSAPEDPLVCENGFEEVAGACERICDDGFSYLGGECVRECGDGFENVGGACRPVCGDGFVADGDKCVPDCADGMRPEGAACVRDCAPGYVPTGRGGACELDCPDDSYPEGDTCRMRCPRNTYELNGECVAVPDPDAEDCPEGSHPDADAQRCVPDTAAGGGGGAGDAGGASECTLHTDCPLGSHCDADRCISRCLQDVDCGAGMSCNDRAMCIQGGGPNAGIGDGSGGDLANSQKNVSSEAGCATAITPSGATTRPSRHTASRLLRRLLRR